MRPRPSRWTAVIFLAAAFAGCSGEPTAPPAPGTVRTTIVTTGGDPDTNGYELSVGPIARQTLPSNGTVTNVVPAGAHSITVEGVADNCGVSGPNPRTIIVAPGALVEVAIEVSCGATGIKVTVRTEGSVYAGSHNISLNDRWAGMVAANGSVVISRLQPGTYTVSLALLPDHCRVSGSHPLTIEVKTRSVTPVSFDIVCVAPTRVERIAYSDANMIKTVNIEGTSASEVVVGHSPAWSPDGSEILFSNTYCDYYGDCTGGIAVFNTLTKNVRILAQLTGFSPAWAPTNDAIAFVDREGRLAVAALSTLSPVLLERPDARYVGSPSWSPDGQRIVFSCSGGAETNLCVINRDGTKLERLTSGSAFNWSPAWGPHGRIAFTRGSGTRAEIVILDPDGRLTSIAAGIHPAWSRDGSKIVFASTDGLFIVDADGRNLSRITSGKHYDPDWRP